MPNEEQREMQLTVARAIFEMLKSCDSPTAMGALAGALGLAIHEIASPERKQQAINGMRAVLNLIEAEPTAARH